MSNARSRAIADFYAPPKYARCPSRKVPWQSEAEAQREADRLNADPDGWGKNYPYRCDDCGRWHNGRPHKGKSVH